jgi:hypothetical protein
VNAQAAMEAHLSTGDRTLARAIGSAAEEFEGDLDEWRARVTSGIFRKLEGDREPGPHLEPDGDA